MLQLMSEAELRVLYFCAPLTSDETSRNHGATANIASGTDLVWTEMVTFACGQNASNRLARTLRTVWA